MRGPQKQTKTMSVCFWESGGTSCPNDDEVIGPCDLIVEREVIGPCDLIVERAVTERKTPDLEHILVARSLYLSLVGPQGERH